MVVVVLAAITDTGLQLVGVLPVTGSRRFEHWQSALALSYHLLFVVVGASISARLAPGRPMAHALAFGVVGLVMSVLGLVAILQGDLAPAWYGWALVVLGLPAAWLGGQLFLRRGRGRR
jgi:hypothetical protein